MIPLNMSQNRAEKLMSSRTKTFEILSEKTQQMRPAIMTCSSAEDAPVIAFVSKMMPVERHCLPQHKPRPLSAEDIAQRRLQARLKHTELMNQEQQGQLDPADQQLDRVTKQLSSTTVTCEEKKDDHVFIAFARIFSGTLRRGQRLYVLGPKYDPCSEKPQDVDPFFLNKTNCGFDCN